MRKLLAIGLFACVGSNIPLANGMTDIEKGFVGKVCRGTYDTGTGRMNGSGIIQIRFYDKEGALTLDLRTRFSNGARPEDPLVDIPASEGLEVNPSMDGTQIKFGGKRSMRWTLNFDPRNGKLTGEIDPRGDPARVRWNIAMVDMACAGIAPIPDAK